MAFGLGILVTTAAHASTGGLTAGARLAGQVSAALTAGSVLLALSLIAALALIVPAAAARRHMVPATVKAGPGMLASDGAAAVRVVARA